MPLWSLSFNNRWCLFSVIFRIFHTDNIARSLVLLIIDDEDDEGDVHAFTWRRLHYSHKNNIHYIGYTVNRSSTQNISCWSTMKTNISVTLPSTAVPMIFNRWKRGWMFARTNKWSALIYVTWQITWPPQDEPKSTWHCAKHYVCIRHEGGTRVLKACT